MFKPRLRRAAGNLPPVPGGDPGAANRALEILGLQPVSGVPVLHVHPKGGRGRTGTQGWEATGIQEQEKANPVPQQKVRTP